MKKLRGTTSIVLVLVAMALIGRALSANDSTASSLSTAKPLGTFVLGAITTPGCPTGFTCNTFTVSCPGISEDATGVIAVQEPIGQVKAMAIFFSAGPGTDWWDETSTQVPSFFQSLLNDGFELVEVRWLTIGWLQAPVGVQSGQEALACRPATVIKWVHDNWYAPLGLHPNVGQCGFCITGNSGGAAQVTYPLASYGLDSIIDAAIPSSGPPLASIEKGCLQEPGYAYPVWAENIIDLGYGFLPSTGGGPCLANNPSFTNTWIANSVETGGTDYYYPATRIHIIIGGLDSDMVINHANDYFQVLSQAQQPMLTWQVVPTMAHEIEASADGLSALLAALTGQSSPTPTPSPTATPTPTATPKPTPTPTPAPPTANPIFVPAPGDYYNAGTYYLFVGMACSTPGSQEYYTTNGTTPAPPPASNGKNIPQNAGYAGGFAASDSPVTLKVIASNTGQANSNVVSGTYTIHKSADPRTQIPDPQIGPAAGSYQLEPNQTQMSFVVATAIPGAAIRYTLDGSTPTSGHGTLINQMVGRIDFSLALGQSSQTFNLQVIAYGLGKTPSNVKAFTITLHR